MMTSSSARFLRWLLLWAVAYAATLLAYNASYESTKGVLVETLQVRPAKLVLAATMPGVTVWHQDVSLFAPGLEVKILRGCDGIEAWLLMATAILVYPMPWRRRLSGIGWGTALIFSLNIVRIVSLFHIAFRRPEWMEVAHGLVWQSIMVLAAAVFVLARLDPSQDAPKKAGGEPA